MIKNFRCSVLKESKEPSLKAYIQSLEETVSAFKASSDSGRRRIEIVHEQIRGIKRHVRRLQEKIKVLEETSCSTAKRHK